MKDLQALVIISLGLLPVLHIPGADLGSLLGGAPILYNFSEKPYEYVLVRSSPPPPPATVRSSILSVDRQPLVSPEHNHFLRPQKTENLFGTVMTHGIVGPSLVLHLHSDLIVTGTRLLVALSQIDLIPILHFM